jgi:hypothetical protein
MEDFFQSTFGIWTDPYIPGISTCHPVQPEELVALIGLSHDHSKAMLSTQWDSTLQRLWAALGKECLATFFDSLIQAEVEANKQAVQPYTSPAMAPAFQAMIVLNKVTTYPLPMEDDWHDATSTDHNLALLPRILTEKSQVTKAELTEMAYYEEWKSD